MPGKLSVTAREISAGGVVLREISGVWHVALIEPQKPEPHEGDSEATTKSPSKPVRAPSKSRRALLGLPKGLVDAGEKPQAAAIREVLEETGIVAEPVTKLSDNKYVYVRYLGRRQASFQSRELLPHALSIGRNRQPDFRDEDRSQARCLGPHRRCGESIGIQQ